MTSTPDITLRISAKPYEDHDDCLTAAVEAIGDETGIPSWALTADWWDGDDDTTREHIRVEVDAHYREHLTAHTGWVADAIVTADED